MLLLHNWDTVLVLSESVDSNCNSFGFQINAFCLLFWFSIFMTMCSTLFYNRFAHRIIWTNIGKPTIIKHDQQISGQSHTTNTRFCFRKNFYNLFAWITILVSAPIDCCLQKKEQTLQIGFQEKMRYRYTAYWTNKFTLANWIEKGRCMHISAFLMILFKS